MNTLKFCVLCRNVSAVNIIKEFHTGSVLLRKGRGRVPRRIPYDPGLRHRGAAFEKDAEVGEEIEDEDQLNDEVNVNYENIYDEIKSDKKKKQLTLSYLITAKKFFSSNPQPLTLTCNERQCIRYLHAQDPVQWNLKTLSESFPATPEGIKKVLRAKWKITPERAKILDSKAQKNWELLADGKLEADPHVLEHLKKFINRREILLEQIKNEKFYLPEVKKEVIWNQGEFNDILSKYEKAVKQLAEPIKTEQKMLKNGVSEDLNEKKENALDLVHDKISEAVSKYRLEEKESFKLGGLMKFYSNTATLEELENKILRKAEARKKLNLLDKALLDSKLGVHSQSTSESIKGSSKSPILGETQEMGNMKDSESLNSEGIKLKTKQDEENTSLLKNNAERSFIGYRKKIVSINARETVPQFSNSEYITDEKTQFTEETGVSQLLHKLKNSPEVKVALEPEKEIVNDKLKVNFSDPVRLERENKFYDKEVKDIEKTAFWDSGSKSKEKAKWELEKKSHDGPLDVSAGINLGKTAIFSSESYPEKIKIPKEKWKPGLTYRVKDCYYDDDGEFLYRVPGMTKY